MFLFSGEVTNKCFYYFEIYETVTKHNTYVDFHLFSMLKLPGN